MQEAPMPFVGPVACSLCAAVDLGRYKLGFAAITLCLVETRFFSHTLQSRQLVQTDHFENCTLQIGTSVLLCTHNTLSYHAGLPTCIKPNCCAYLYFHILLP